MFSREEARNPNPETLIKCAHCQQSSPLSGWIKEENLPIPHHLVVEGFLQCPHCQAKTHSYYMSERTRHIQSKLHQAIAEWHLTKSKISFAQMRSLKISYTKLHDADQKKYSALYGEKAVVDHDRQS